MAKPQHDGSWRAPTNAPACRSDSYHIRRRGAKSFVDDLVLSRGVVLSRADLFCDLLRLSPLTRRFVSFRLTYLPYGEQRRGYLTVAVWVGRQSRKDGRCDARIFRVAHRPFFSIFSKRMSEDQKCTRAKRREYWPGGSVNLSLFLPAFPR